MSLRSLSRYSTYMHSFSSSSFKLPTWTNYKEWVREISGWRFFTLIASDIDSPLYPLILDVIKFVHVLASLLNLTTTPSSQFLYVILFKRRHLMFMLLGRICMSGYCGIRYCKVLCGLVLQGRGRYCGVIGAMGWGRCRFLTNVCSRL